jgi:hypothetical protein
MKLRTIENIIKHKDRDAKNKYIGVINYNNGIFTVNCKGNIIYQISSESLSPIGKKRVYATPANIRFELWSKYPTQIQFPTELWSPVYPGMKVKGKIDDMHIFHIIEIIE